MRLYLAGWIGSGTDTTSYRPNVDAATWAAIDFRPDPTVVDGRVLVATDQPITTVPSGVVDLGDQLDTNLKVRQRRDIESVLGVILTETTLRGIIVELLVIHGQPDLPIRTRWRRLKANSRGRHVIRLLEETIYDAPAVQGATFTDDFNRADEELGVSADWKEVSGDIDVVSNEAFTAVGGGESYARAESALASDDHYAQADVTATSIATSVTCRNNTPGTDTAGNSTFYMWRYGTNKWELHKRVSGSFTLLGSLTESEPATPYTIRVEADGSSISGIANTVTKVSATDTAITGNLKTGLRHSSGTASGNWDNFEAGDLAGGTVSLSGSGANAVDGTATLDVTRDLAGSGANAADGTGTLTVDVAPIDLSGAGASVASGTGSLDLTRDLAGVGAAAVAGFGTLAALRGLSGAGANVSAGSGTLRTVGTTFWTSDPVAYTAAPVAYTPAAADEPPPW